MGTFDDIIGSFFILHLDFLESPVSGREVLSSLVVEKR